MLIYTNSDLLSPLATHHRIVHFPAATFLRYPFRRTDHKAIVIFDLDKAEGLNAAATIRQKGTNVPLIGLTAVTNTLTEWHAAETTFREQGGDELLPKPIDQRQVLACITAIERRFGAIAPIMYLFDEQLVVDTANEEVRYRGSRVALTKRENDLFMDLVRHYGQIRSNDELLESLYGHRREQVTRGNVGVFVHNIRQKLKQLQPGLEDLIENLPWQGYRLTDRRFESRSNN